MLTAPMDRKDDLMQGEIETRFLRQKPPDG
jgi:hypothetical protein